jgi:DNA-binding XRE family transcriptional regulator
MRQSLSQRQIREQDMEAFEGFAAALPRYLRCSTRIQGVVCDLVQVFNDPDTRKEERERVLTALAVTLCREPPSSSEPKDPPARQPRAPDEALWRRKLEEEENLFVANLKRLMEDRKLTQAELAERAGLSQPAISMMLARRYRPQRRTIRLLAQVLGVAENELSPEVPDAIGPSANGTRPGRK